MGKRAKKTTKSQVQPAASQRHLKLAEFVRRNLMAFVIREGMKALDEMLEQDCVSPADRWACNPQTLAPNSAVSQLSQGLPHATPKPPAPQPAHRALLIDYAQMTTRHTDCSRRETADDNNRGELKPLSPGGSCRGKDDPMKKKTHIKAGEGDKVQTKVQNPGIGDQTGC